MERTRWNARFLAILVLVALAVADYAHEILSQFGIYRMLYHGHPYYVPESLDKMLGALLCCLAIYVLHRVGPRGIARELGLTARILPALAFALLVSLPMLVGIALTRKVSSKQSVPDVVFLTVFSPFVEELEFRGFGFWQLHPRARWPFWLAIIPPAVLFALGHVEKGQGWKEVAGIFLLTGTGSAVFSWLLKQWQSLWAPFGLHFCMNLWWEIFSVSNTAVGGWFPFALKSKRISLAILFTRDGKRPGLLAIQS